MVSSSKTASTARNRLPQCSPSLHRKGDKDFYFTYKGKQYYAGSTPEAANRKLLEIVGIGNSDGRHSIKDAVKEYLDSIEGAQLKWSDIDLVKRVLVVRSGKGRQASGDRDQRHSPRGPEELPEAGGVRHHHDS
jgi:hypothetical protein